MRNGAARVVTACAPLLGLAAFAVLRWVELGAEPVTEPHEGEDELRVWEFLVTASVVAWAVLAGLGLRLLRELDDRGVAAHRRRTAEFALFVYVTIAIVLVAGGVRNEYVMHGQDWKVPLLHVVAGLANLPLLVVLERIRLAARDPAGWSTTGRDVERLRFLRGCAQTATAALGLVIALAVVATGALREATLAADFKAVPDTFVLVYGAWFTGVVAAVHLYVLGALEARGRWLLDQAAPLPAPDAAEAFATARARRQELADELGLGADLRQNLEGVLAVLAPIAGALLTRLAGA